MPILAKNSQQTSKWEGTSLTQSRALMNKPTANVILVIRNKARISTVMNSVQCFTGSFSATRQEKR